MVADGAMVARRAASGGAPAAARAESDMVGARESATAPWVYHHGLGSAKASPAPRARRAGYRYERERPTETGEPFTCRAHGARFGDYFGPMTPPVGGTIMYTSR